MNYFYAFIIIVLFYIAFKFLFIQAYVDFTERYLFKNKKDFFKFILNPVLSVKSKDRYLNLYYYLGLLLSTVWGLLIASRIQEYIDISRINLSIGILYILSLLFFILFLLYLSIFDIISFSIPEVVSKRMLLFALVVNILFLILKIVLSTNEISYVFYLINLGSILNLIGGILGGGLIWIIVKVSKERAMGAGDIDILAAIGLMLGFPSIFYSFFYTLVSASIISILYVGIKRKYKGVLIPFVPFLSTGFILCLVLKDLFLRLFNIF